MTIRIHRVSVLLWVDWEESHILGIYASLTLAKKEKEIMEKLHPKNRYIIEQHDLIEE